MGATSFFRRATKWTTLSLAALTLAAFSFSWIRSIVYKGPGQGILLDEGVLTVHWGFAPYGAGNYGWAVDPIKVRLGFRLLWIERLIWPDGRAIVYVPLWIPLALLMPASIVISYWARRRPPKGTCTNCGYNLTGNRSRICPECGTKLDEARPGAPQKRKPRPRRSPEARPNGLSV